MNDYFDTASDLRKVKAFYGDMVTSVKGLPDLLNTCSFKVFLTEEWSQDFDAYMKKHFTVIDNSVVVRKRIFKHVLISCFEDMIDAMIDIHEHTGGNASFSLITISPLYNTKVRKIWNFSDRNFDSFTICVGGLSGSYVRVEYIDEKIAYMSLRKNDILFSSHTRMTGTRFHFPVFDEKRDIYMYRKIFNSEFMKKAIRNISYMKVIQKPAGFDDLHILVPAFIRVAH